VVGLCGSAEKAAWLVGAGIVDHAIDYKGRDLARELAKERAEIYWDNAGK
jgi:NADPH-dependent curcumin reductase CurA